VINKLKSNEFRFAFITTIPVLLGYLAIGLAFGLLLSKAGYHWLLALIMSVVIYAGAGQYLAVGFFIVNASFVEIAIVTFLVNSRHMVYGLSLLQKFSQARFYKPYMIFSLTDETYALITTSNVPEDLDRVKVYFFIGLLDHFYWIMGGVIGAVLGSLINFNTKGLDFALTALFVVLLIEQFRNCKNKIPFVIAFVCGILSLVFIKSNMLIISIVASIFILILFNKVLKDDELN